MVMMDFLLVEGYYTSKAVSIEQILSCSLNPWKGSLSQNFKKLTMFGVVVEKTLL